MTFRARSLAKPGAANIAARSRNGIALRFTGDDSEINISEPGGGQHKPEFIDWRWVELKSLPDLVVPFKRQTYEQVVKEFAQVRETA